MGRLVLIRGRSVGIWSVCVVGLRSLLRARPARIIQEKDGC